VLLGPSGTGKSAFLKTLIGLLTPEKGKIIIYETDLVKCSESREGPIGMSEEKNSEQAAREMDEELSGCRR
jgi:ABC-type transporter Mla maintaining outer membrane lipid asymmetry ATPase subunit MlaF